jgi:hypothetical protein
MSTTHHALFLQEQCDKVLGLAIFIALLVGEGAIVRDMLPENLHRLTQLAYHVVGVWGWTVSITHLRSSCR